MEIITQDEVTISNLSTRLNQGEVIVYPTETCYGIGCDSSNQQAVEELYKIKQRRKDKPVLVIMSGLDMAREYVHWNEKLQQLAEKYWPGPLTLVAKARADKNLVKPQVIAENETLAFRFSSHPLSQKIVEEIDVPLVSTSANISSQDTPYDICKVKEMFGGEKHQPDLIIDGGALSAQSPSTIAKVDQGEVNIIRQGELVLDEH